ncbi:hypothetical protein GDO86_012285 [Hymenochirus boettgeri]|uniref:Uncharacterized protein n=1 Tax=Hymenochirus boettgeri TaxID=247094 RepID=A0A8T2IQL3_9PIPI|nr:hypothetical protein GDO86_012285 [Hymenochirus boettgeri]
MPVVAYMSRCLCVQGCRHLLCGHRCGSPVDMDRFPVWAQTLVPPWAIDTDTCGGPGAGPCVDEGIIETGIIAGIVESAWPGTCIRTY